MVTSGGNKKSMQKGKKSFSQIEFWLLTDQR